MKNIQRWLALIISLLLLQGCTVVKEEPKYKKIDVSNISTTLLTDNLEETLPNFLLSVLPNYTYKIIETDEIEMYQNNENMEYNTIYIHYFPQNEEDKIMKSFEARIFIKTHDAFEKPIRMFVSTNNMPKTNLSTIGRVKNNKAIFTYDASDSYSGDLYIGLKDKYLSERLYDENTAEKAFYYEYTQIKYALADAFLKQTNLS